VHSTVIHTRAKGNRLQTVEGVVDIEHAKYGLVATMPAIDRAACYGIKQWREKRDAK